MAGEKHTPETGHDSTGREDGANRQAIPGLPPAPPYRDDERNREFYEQAGLYGVMYAGDYEWDNERCTAEAFGEYDADDDEYHITRDGQPRRSLLFHTTWMGVETAKRCVRHIGTYNRFSAEACIDLLDDLPRPVAVVVGRERSPVLYVWTGQPNTVLRRFHEMGDGHNQPDELGAFADPSHYPTRTIGSDIPAPTTGCALIRSWWD